MEGGKQKTSSYIRFTESRRREREITFYINELVVVIKTTNERGGEKTSYF